MHPLISARLDNKISTHLRQFVFVMKDITSVSTKLWYKLISELLREKFLISPLLQNWGFRAEVFEYGRESFVLWSNICMALSEVFYLRLCRRSSLCPRLWLWHNWENRGESPVQCGPAQPGDCKLHTDTCGPVSCLSHLVVMMFVVLSLVSVISWSWCLWSCLLSQSSRSPVVLIFGLLSLSDPYTYHPGQVPSHLFQGNENI